MHRDGDIYSIAVSNDLVLTGSSSHRIHAWKPLDCHAKGYIHASSGEVRAMVAHGILYTGSFDRTVKAWRINEKKCVDSFIAHGGNINDMVVNQQNGYLITCSSDGTVKMWLRVYGENSHALIRVLVFHAYPFHALAFSVAVSNKSFLYSGSTDGTINYWEQEISCRYTHGGFLQGHRFAVLSLVTIENIVISGSEDSTIRIWKREKGRGNIHECLAVLEGHRGPVRCLATFLQKDKFALSFLVYSASLDQTFKAWRVKLSPEVKKSPFGDDDDDREESKSQMEFETSPVLSPSWVKKKLQISRSLHKLV
uniref:Uncharacterized protein n=1 Tax=Chenopodium quinoa TaxID=63459 RepID=A0A803N7F6_CHEQI